MNKFAYELGRSVREANQKTAAEKQALDPNFMKQQAAMGGSPGGPGGPGGAGPGEQPLLRHSLGRLMSGIGLGPDLPQGGKLAPEQYTNLGRRGLKYMIGGGLAAAMAPTIYQHTLGQGGLLDRLMGKVTHDPNISMPDIMKPENFGGISSGEEETWNRWARANTLRQMQNRDLYAKILQSYPGGLGYGGGMGMGGMGMGGMGMGSMYGGYSPYGRGMY